MSDEATEKAFGEQLSKMRTKVGTEKRAYLTKLAIREAVIAEAMCTV